MTYRDHPAIAQSDLKLYFANPMAFWRHKVLGEPAPDRKTAEMDFGVRAEAFCLHPESVVVVPDEYLSKPNKRTGVRSKSTTAYQTFCQENPGKVVFTKVEMAEMQQVAEFTQENHPRVARLLFEHRKELSKQIFWECPHTGLERKAELDIWLPEQRFIVDFKTCADPSQGAIERAIYQFGYHIQAATYMEGMRELGEEPEAYLIVAVRNVWPYDCEAYDLRCVIAEGDDWNRREMLNLAADLERNEWGPATKEHFSYVERPLGYLGYIWDRPRKED